jgi:predicted acetyltransferase
MPVDIRPLTEDDRDRWRFVERTAFMDSPEIMDWWMRNYFTPEWGLVAIVDGDIQAASNSIPMELGLEGNNVRMGGVTSVACLPEYRRQGLVAALLRETLERSHARGEPLSGLWTPHPALYRRFGWETCTESYEVTFNPKHVSLEPGPQPAGKIERAGIDDWKAADSVYRQVAMRSNSLVMRDETRWRMTIDFVNERALYIYRSESGEPEAFAIMEQSQSQGSRLMVRDLFAASSDGYRALLALALSHDLAETVQMWTSTQDPLLDIVADPRQVKREPLGGLMLRVVDVAEAFAQRPAYAEGRLVLRLEDRDCPWNEGTWEITSRGHRLSAEPCDDEPMLSLDARALAQLYNGFRSASLLARAGRRLAHHPRAVAMADVLFAMRTRPFCADDF